ncbi:MAG: hypothetical protein R2710_09780 [Acidimicrobiales bacterium]
MKHLVYEISVVLGVNQEWPVVIVGSGNLGRALANSKRSPTEASGTSADRHRPGARRAACRRCRVPARPTGTPRARTGHHRRRHRDAGQRRPRRRRSSRRGTGVTSLLNFTADPLVVDDDVQVRGVDLASELQILSFYQQRTSSARDGVGVPLATLRALEQEAAG